MSVLWESAVPSPQSQPRFRSLFPANYRHKGELLREKVLLLKQLLCSAGELRRLRVPSFTRVTGVTRIRERCRTVPKARGALVWGALPALCTGVRELGTCGTGMQHRKKRQLQSNCCSSSNGQRCSRSRMIGAVFLDRAKTLNAMFAGMHLELFF